MNKLQGTGLVMVDCCQLAINPFNTLQKKKKKKKKKNLILMLKLQNKTKMMHYYSRKVTKVHQHIITNFIDTDLILRGGKLWSKNGDDHQMGWDW